MTATTVTTAAKPVSALKLMRDFFGMNLAEMKAEYTPMPQVDKDQLIAGLTDGTLTY